MVVYKGGRAYFTTIQYTLSPLCPPLCAHILPWKGKWRGVDSWWLAERGDSLLLGEEGIMKDGGVCLERGMGTVGSLTDGYD